MTQTKLLAFHGDPAIKAKYVARLQMHHAQDQIVTPDELCLYAVQNGLIRVDAEKGTAISIQQRERVLGCTNTQGYRVFTLHVGSVRKQIKMHRLIWISAFGAIPKGLIPDHINRNRADNRIFNLRLVDAKGNAANRRSYQGEANPAAKITREIAEDIRKEYQQVRSYSLLAQTFCISKSLVAQIVRGKMWN